MISDLPIFCENLFEKLSSEDPDLLKFYISECNMSNGHLTIALPHLSKTKNTKYWVSITDHLHSKSPVVREGVLIALWNYGDVWKDDVISIYKEIAECDENKTIREVAEDYYLELTENYDIWFGDEL